MSSRLSENKGDSKDEKTLGAEQKVDESATERKSKKPKLFKNNNNTKDKSSKVKEVVQLESPSPSDYQDDVLMRQAVAMELSRAITDGIEETVGVIPTPNMPNNGIYLFNSSVRRIVESDLDQVKTVLRKRPRIIPKRHIDGSESEDEDEKLRSVAVTSAFVYAKKF